MTDEPTVISGEQVREVLMELGVPVAGIYCLDGTYQLFSESDVREKIRDAFTDVLIKLRYTYKKGRRDCENFGGFMWGWAAYWHGEQRDESDNGVALGLMCNSEIGHGFCFAIHRSDAGVLYACAYEPQRDASGFSCGQIAVPWKETFLCVC